MSNRIDISDIMEQFCERLGLPYTDVASIHFEPSDVIARVYLRNAQGAKYIAEDGLAAEETREFKVRA